MAAKHRVRNIRFTDKDWAFIKFVAALSRVKVSDIVRHGTMKEANRVFALNKRKESSGGKT